MADRSPATRAIVAAFDARYELCGPFDDNWQELCLAAALRAAVDQVVPEENVDEADYNCLHSKWAAQGKQEARRELLAIAAELEGQQ